jgi:transposase
MSLVLDDLLRDPSRLLQHLQRMTEVVTQQNASLVSLQAKHNTVLAERDTARTERDLIREEHEAAQAEIEKLRLLIRQLQRGQFGRRSERLDPDQLQLGLEDLEQTVAAAEVAQEEAAARNSTPRPPRVRRRNLGALPAHLPRVEVLVDVEDKNCPCCGGTLHAIGEDREEMLDIVPAQLRVKVIRRPRYGCRTCEEAVVQAPAPERPITGGMATEALLAHVLVAKYADFLPLYRQAQIFARQGIELDRSTLCDWVGRACWWLEPLWRLLRRHVMSSTRIFADDTLLPVLDPGRGRTKTGRLWGYAIDDRSWGGETPPAVVYLYAEDRKGERPATHLAEFRGVLQVDGYGGFKSLLANRPPGEIRLAFCWAHCRRRFYDIHQETGSALAEEALRRIGELYAIETEIRGRPPDERRASRQERSQPVVDALHVWLTAQLGRVSGRSTLA